MLQPWFLPKLVQKLRVLPWQHAQKYHIIGGPSCMLVNFLYSKILFLKMYLFINRIRRYLRNLQSLVGQPFLTPHFEGMQSHIGGDFSKLPFMISPLPAYSCQIGRSFSATKKDASELRTLLGKCNGLKFFFQKLFLNFMHQFIYDRFTHSTLCTPKRNRPEFNSSSRKLLK